MSLPRLYYTLPELAEKWKRSENDLLHMAATGALELSINHIGSAVTWDNELDDVKISGYVQLEPSQCKHIVEFGIGKYQKFSTAWWNGKQVRAFEELAPPVGLPVRKFTIFNTSDLLILPDEVARAEAKFPELAGRDEAAVEAADHTHKETAVQDCILYDIQSQVELAKRCSVTPKTVSNWTKKKGLLTEEVPGGGRRYSTAATVKWLEQNKKHKELELFNNSK